LVFHRAELADSERFAILSYAVLKEENRPFRVEFDEHGDDEQGQKKHHKPNECCDTVEAPFEAESYFVFIFRHAA
jgi:hypothetical protein